MATRTGTEILFRTKQSVSLLNAFLKVAAENLDQHYSDSPDKTPLPRTSTSLTANSSHYAAWRKIQDHDEIYCSIFRCSFDSRESLLEASVEILVARVRVVDVLGHLTNIPSEL